MNLRRVCAGLGAVMSMALLASCGGNASRIKPFTPTAMVVLGDESSLIEKPGAGSTVPGASDSNGLKYTINAVDQTTGNATSGQVVCSANPIWVQYLSTTFTFDFAACASSTPMPRATMKAKLRAKVADLQTQVDEYRSSVGFNPTTLVTVSVGQWDLYDIYAANKSNEAAALALAEAAGAQLGRIINDITASGNGGRVIYVEMMSPAWMPWAAAESDAGKALLTNMALAFNEGQGVSGGKGLLATVTNNGRWSGSVEPSKILALMVATSPSPNSFGLTNVNTGACLATAALPNCSNNGYPTTLTDLRSDAVDTSGVNRYMWADDYRLGPSAHDALGNRARVLATTLPF